MDKKVLLKKLSRYKFIGGLAGLALLIFSICSLMGYIPTKAAFIDDPDSINIERVYIFPDVLEENDWLVYMRYDIDYTSEPDESATQVFEMAIYDTDGTTLIQTRPVNYYQNNIISIYFTPAQATTSGLVWTSNYQVKVRGMVGRFDAIEENVNMDTLVLGSSVYKTQDELGVLLLNEAEILEAIWGITILSGDLLNDTGAYYFLKAIPNLNSMDPLIFSETITYMTANYTDWNHTYEATLITNQGPRLQGAIQAIGALFGFGEMWAAILLVTLAALTFSGVVYAVTKDPGISILMGLPVAVGAAYLGLGDGQWFTIVMAIFAVTAILFAIHFILTRYA